MAGLHFDITGDNANFLRKLDEARNGVRTTSKQIEESGVSIEQMFGRLAKGAAAFGAGITAKEIVSSIVRVRGEFQQLEVAFNTMLGSEQKATALMSQLVKTAATTPFDLQSVAQGAKQLLAYGDNVENVNEDLVRLGNIAAGLSQPLNDLVYLYGTTMTQGRLYTQDFNQFTGRGIPMIKELAKQFNVAESEVKGLVEAGKVGFPEVQKVIQSLTNEGGMFFNLMEEQSKTITGQISNIEDSIATMYNNIGKQSEGFINDSLSGVSYLVENYEEVGKTVLELAAIYGAYKAAIIVLSAVEKARYTATLAMSATEKTLTTWQAIRFASTEKLTSAQKALNAAMLKNPYVLAGAAIAGLCYGIYKLTTYQTDAEKAQLKLNDAIKEAEKASLSEHRELARLKGELSALTKGSDEYNVVKGKIIKNFGKYYSGLDTEIEKVGLTEQAYTKLTEAINKSFGARQYEKFASEQQEELSNTMSENLGKIQDGLLEELGDDYGSKIYAKIRNGIMQGSLSLGTKSFEIQGLDDETKSALNKAAGEEGGFLDFTNRSIEGYIQNIILANRATEQLDKKARNRFGIDDNSGKKTDDTKVHSEAEKKAASEWLSSYKKVYEDADKAYNDFLKSKQVMSEADRDKELKRLKEERDMAKSTYEGKGGSVSSNTKQDNQADKLLQQQEKYNLLLDKQKREQERMKTDSLHELEQIEINALQEGSEKILRQRALNHQKELEAIKREAAEKQLRVIEEARSAFEANPDKNKGAFDADKFVKSEPAKKQFAVFDKVAESKVKTEEIKYNRGDDLNNLINEYQDFSDRRLAIENKFNEDIKVLDAQRKTALEKGDMGQVDKIDRSKVEAEKKKKEDLSSVSMDEFKADIDWATLFGNLNVLSPDMLNKLRDKLKAFIESAAGKLTPEDLKTLSEAMTNVDLTIADKTPYEALKTGLSGYKTATDEASVAQSKLNKLEKEGKEGTKEYKNATKELTDAQKKRAESLNTITQAANNIGSKGMEVVNAGNQVVDMLGNLGVAVPEAVGATLDGIGQVMSGLESIDLTKPFSAITGSIGILTGIGNTIAGIFGFGNKDAKNEKNIGRLQDQIEALEKSYAKLGDSIEKAYSKDASKLINQQNTLFEQQKVLIQNQIREEQDKKKTDDGRIKEWQNQIEEINKLIEDNKEKAIDAIFGEDLKSSINNFAQAYANAWTSGEDKAKSAKDTVRDMMRQMVTESIKAAIQSSGKMEEIRNKLKQFYADNVLSGWEQDYIYNMADNLQKELDNKFGWADGLMKDEKATSQDSTKGGFEAMSQDTGTELNGRFTAFQISNEEIKNSMLSMLASVSLLSVSVNSNGITLIEIRNLMISSNSYLEDIAKYTKLLIDCKKELETIKNNTKSL